MSRIKRSKTARKPRSRNSTLYSFLLTANGRVFTSWRKRDNLN